MNVSYPADAKPRVQMNHIDGPLLHLRNGKLHWLTLTERVQLFFGWTSVEKLEKKHWRTA